MIRISNLNKRFSGVDVVRDVNLSVSKKGITVILGPSGCGKTTLLRLMAGLEKPDHGEMQIDGSIVSAPGRLVAPRKRDLSMVFQDLALWPHMRVAETVAFGLRKEGSAPARIRERVMDVLRWVGLEALSNRYPHELSGGEKQRLAIARALAPGNDYLLMDEPFSNLDPPLKEALIKLTRRLPVSFGTTILYVTHNLDEALALADRILLMSRGKMAGELGPDELKNLSQEDLLVWYKEKTNA